MMSDSQLAIADSDYSAKLAQLVKENAFYEQKMSDGGLSSTARFAKFHPQPHQLFTRNAIFAHRDLEQIAVCMENNSPWAVVSGINPSGPLHFGHKTIFDQLLWYQKQGAHVYIPITNDETFAVGKSSSIAQSKSIAYESVIPSIIAFGFDSARTSIYVDTDYSSLYPFAFQIAAKLPLSKVMGVFGVPETENVATLFYRAGVQIAQILLPQLPEFGGPKPTLIPVGIDQLPYVQLARDCALKLDMIPPSPIYTKFQFGLDGRGKMSASRAASVVFLTDEPTVAAEKIKKAYTFGNPYSAYQREHGGIPNICPVGQLHSYHFDDVTTSCRNGSLLCGDCKKGVIEFVSSYLREHQARLPAARAIMNDFLLKTKFSV